MSLLHWLKRGDTKPPMPQFPPSERVRKHFLFSGRVQNVGFRYECWMTAEPLGLVGWVRNLPDGDVEAEVEGEEARIEYFIQAIQSRRGIHITHIETRSLPVQGNETAFRIAN